MADLHERCNKTEAELRRDRDRARTEVHRVADLLTGETARADRAEDRLARVRDMLNWGNREGAFELLKQWDLERKRRGRG